MYVWAVALMVVVLGQGQLNSQTCDGIYHDGATSNSIFGDGWDNFWGLDWSPEVKMCLTKVSGKISMTGFEILADAAAEVAGCGGGSDSCCEALCTTGAG